MARIDIAPTKSNLYMIKEQLNVAKMGHTLLDQKREILLMELLRVVDKTKMLEREIDKVVQDAYPALQGMLLTAGGDRVERLSKGIKYDYSLTEKDVSIAGIHFSSLDVKLPDLRLFHSSLDSFASTDKVMTDFFHLLRLLTELASIRTIVWRLAMEVRKTQRRVNALDKIVIPQTKETKAYIESSLDERERENIFSLKSLKNKQTKS